MLSPIERGMEKWSKIIKKPRKHLMNKVARFKKTKQSNVKKLTRVEFYDECFVDFSR